MDQLLRARNMGSASARRLKSQSRERAAQAAEDRRVRRLLYGYSSDEGDSSDDENAPTFSPITDDKDDEPSASASSADPAALSRNRRPAFEGNRFLLSVEPPKLDHRQENTRDQRGSETSRSNSRSMLATPHPSLLNREPTIVDADDARTIDYHNDVSGAEDDFNPPPSPGIPHTAKSIQYLIPIARPSLVSIRTSLYPLRTSSLNDQIRNAPPMLTPPPRSAKRLSSMSLVQDSGGSDSSSTGTSPSSSSEELAYSEIRGFASNTSSTVPGQVQDTEHPAMLSSARTPSFTRPKTSNGGEEHEMKPLVPSHLSFVEPPTSRASTASTTSALTHPRLSRHFTLETTPTAKLLSKPSQPSILEQPTVEALPRIGPQPIVSTPTEDAKPVSRKKSLSGLRSRSESIGKAIRSASSSVKSRGRFPVMTSAVSPPVPEIHPDVKRMGSDANISEVKQAIRNSDRTSLHGLGLRNMGSLVAMSAR